MTIFMRSHTSRMAAMMVSSLTVKMSSSSRWMISKVFSPRLVRRASAMVSMVVFSCRVPLWKERQASSTALVRRRRRGRRGEITGAQGGAAHQPAAADRGDDAVQRFSVLDEFFGGGGLPGDDVVVVEGWMKVAPVRSTTASGCVPVPPGCFTEGDLRPAFVAAF